MIPSGCQQDRKPAMFQLWATPEYLGVAGGEEFSLNQISFTVSSL